jgi:hypothetical protein
LGSPFDRRNISLMKPTKKASILLSLVR